MTACPRCRGRGYLSDYIDDHKPAGTVDCDQCHGTGKAAKPKRCKWCDAGNAPREGGDHWIVKSIVPANIKIERCRRLPAKP